MCSGRDMPPQDENSVTCKIIIVGDSGVGKTSLMHRFCKGRFVSHETTIGVNFETRPIQLCDKTVNIQIWDTAGQEQYLAITKLYFRYSMGVVFVYDVTKENTLAQMEKWFKVVEEETSPDVIKVLVGHKCDTDICKMVSTDEGRAVADYFGMTFFEASSKEDVDVYPIFYYIASKCINLHHKIVDKHKKESLVLTNENNSNQSGSSCWLNSIFDWLKF